MGYTRCFRRGFSLIELVVVIVILGVIATIAIPRVSRGAISAAEAGLRQDLAIMRSALEAFRAEHESNYPELSEMPLALTGFSNAAGAAQATASATHIFGPYLNAIPPMKLGDQRGQSNFGPFSDSGVAWHYDENTGELRANAAGQDANGVLYVDF